MSVRKQILQSHKTLINELSPTQVVPNIKPAPLTIIEKKNNENAIPKKLTREKTTPRRSTRIRREKTPDSTSDEEVHDNNYSEYSDEESYDNPGDQSIIPEEAESGMPIENVVEQITLIHDIETKIEDTSDAVENVQVKSEETENKSDPITERADDIKEPLSVQPLPPERLLRKRKMIVASNRILKQEKSLSDNRYSNVVFIRKSMRERLKKQEQSNKSRGKKEKTEDDTNIIWKNGKKYAACEICKREVKKHYMKHHMTTHFPEHFSCDICGVTTRNLRGLRYHKLYWHSSKLDYICDKCGKKYRSKHALDLHNKKEHGGVRDLECNICGKKFFQKSKCLFICHCIYTVFHIRKHSTGSHNT